MQTDTTPANAKLSDLTILLLGCTKQIEALVDEHRQTREELAAMRKQLALNITREAYSVEQVSERVKREPETVRQWCNLGNIRATKVHGKGRQGEWRISADELTRVEAEGPSTVGTFDNPKKPSRKVS